MAAVERWVHIKEVAAYLDVARNSIYRWIAQKGFPARRVGRLLRFKLSEVDEWVRGGGQAACPERKRPRAASRRRRS